MTQDLLPDPIAALTALAYEGRQLYVHLVDDVITAMHTQGMSRADIIERCRIQTETLEPARRETLVAAVREALTRRFGGE